jgi:type IV secretory pathway VirD2 relaxase
MKDRNPFEWEHVIRPRMGKRSQPRTERVPIAFRAQIQRALQRHGIGNWIGARSLSGRNRRGAVAVREPNARSRRCVIKGRYVKVKANGKAAKMHLAYLERDGVERDGSPGKLYGADAAFDREAFRAPMKGEQRQFRFIISPEDGDVMNLTDFTRNFMKQVEKDTGRRLTWAAVNHYNTDNPHVHVVIRGLDRDGDDLRIDSRYIKQEMRWRAQEVITRALGPRSEWELKRRRTRDLNREALTPIDRVLAHYQDDHGEISYGRLAKARPIERTACIGRLTSLEQLGLAKRSFAGTWQLEDGWEASLVKMERDADIVQRVRSTLPASLGRCAVVEAGRPLPPIEGTVRALGLDDELSGNMYAIVETKADLPRYVAMRPEIAAQIRVGETVRIGSVIEKWVKPSDHRIARFAQDHGGIYDPAAHQRALQAIRRKEVEGSPSIADLVAANVRRLDRLQRYGLAERVADGRWRVPPDLIAQLETREQSHPRHALRIEVQRSAPDRTVDAEAIDRRSTGERFAKQLRMTYVDSPERLTGRVVTCPPNAAGREYVRVMDVQRGRFTLVPKPPRASELEGRVVTVATDRDRKLSIRVEKNLER